MTFINHRSWRPTLTLALLAAVCVTACAPEADTPREQAAPTGIQVEPSGEADRKLGAVADGVLVASSDYHKGGSADGSLIAFASPGRVVLCAGSLESIQCNVPGHTYPDTPFQQVPQLGTWRPYISISHFGDGPAVLGNGLWSENAIDSPDIKELPEGSTIRFGEVECRSEATGVTCVSYRSSIGFDVSRDRFTPLLATKKLSDDREEPRISGSEYCGAVVDALTVERAADSVPFISSARSDWSTVYGRGAYLCDSLQAFNLERQRDGAGLVLVFENGKFVGSATKNPYIGLVGDIPEKSTDSIDLSFTTGENPPSVRSVTVHRTQIPVDELPPGARRASD
ncbi:hypothetical protein [Mycobacterium sp. D16R24]|uniref:hypothetical protein n=1 Tax=Mycobacterium sp. D16R24 TaxID=1855656 RepID=UPI00111788B5|nr:hypothetical protein [Mycobacterium sp. D16R24]